jgi:aryl-alcohol dehydrogenase-like predicted oxidoreductase
VRYIAASQYSAERLDEALRVSKENGFASYVALQDQYNLMERTGIEGETSKVISEHQISVLPFYGLARGFLSGKYRPGVTVESVRAAGVAKYQNASTPSAVALAWLRAQPTVSVPIASARTVDQLGEIVQVLELRDEDVARLSEITAMSDISG